MQLDLYPKNLKRLENILPKGGQVNYHGPILSHDKADYFFINLLKKIAWQQDEVKLFGKHIITRRKVAWYGDESYSYTYSKITKQARPWTPELISLKQLVEEALGKNFNSCLLNLYSGGDEGMSWHCDNEKELEEKGIIASLSLGAERKFSFKHKLSKETVSLKLQHGSLLVMKGETQNYWLHQLPKSKTVVDPRINLTFRNISN